MRRALPRPRRRRRRVGDNVKARCEVQTPRAHAPPLLHGSAHQRGCAAHTAASVETRSGTAATRRLTPSGPQRESLGRLIDRRRHPPAGEDSTEVSIERAEQPSQPMSKERQGTPAHRLQTALMKANPSQSGPPAEIKYVLPRMPNSGQIGERWCLPCRRRHREGAHRAAPIRGSL